MPRKINRGEIPTVEQVAEYCKQRNNGIDPEYFWAWYGARGWTFPDGRPVVDWKMCVITWEKSNRAAINVTKTTESYTTTRYNDF